ncbi:LacI family DNA-binding transcriptional regulator [Deinococcus enclensis]|uniref:LacI family transcriptional regulator n=1 Tax=Deinococcus enclensis TaxID=1049582 RepID=A0ABT9ME19_9DEIO|nr:substrate-binding domain-containing protein [Deinococcus enclensis]MDP9764474.1 LacI family transcriptional regulator [Deinococcus enclensis]
MPSITLEDVARAAGVSLSTASRVLSGTAKVSAERHAAVMRAATELGYQPNAIARSLASGRSMLIGVITQEISSPFYGEALLGIERGLEGSGYHAIFASGHWQADIEHAALDGLLGRPVDGLILLGGQTPDAVLRALAARLPLITVGRSIQGLEGHCMRVDNVAGGYECTRHLLERGHRAIAYIAGPESHRDARDRLHGHQQALRDWNVTGHPALFTQGDFQETSGLMAVESLFTRGEPFTAIVAANDQMAYGARLALYRRGIRVPDDVSLIGYDDLHSSAFCTPPLTTVRQPMYEMGFAAAEGILAALAGTPLPAPEFAVQLVTRESTTLLRRTPRPATTEDPDPATRPAPAAGSAPMT